MRTFDENSATELVLERLETCPDPRLKEIMASVIRHLHAVVREVEPTPEEWLAAIGFLTVTGQISDDKRQELILLSDVLGVSMLVDAINHRSVPGATESTVLGPFHVEGAQELEPGASISRDGVGDPLIVTGRVLAPDGRPIAGAVLDVWQTAPNGFYDVQDPSQPEMNLRGKFRSDAEGRFRFRSVLPSSYPLPTDGPVGALLAALGRHPYRPAHVHFIITAEGYRPVTTHLFVAGDRYLDSDAVFGVKQSLIAPFVRHDSPEEAVAEGVTAPYYTVAYDFGLEPASRAAWCAP